MDEDIIEETMDSLCGKFIVEWHHGAGGYHCILDDGRMLIFIGLGIMAADEYVLH